MKKWGAAEELSSAAFCIFSLSFENRPTNKNNNDIAMIKPEEQKLSNKQVLFDKRLNISASIFNLTNCEKQVESVFTNKSNDTIDWNIAVDYLTRTSELQKILNAYDNPEDTDAKKKLLVEIQKLDETGYKSKLVFPNPTGEKLSIYFSLYGELLLSLYNYKIARYGSYEENRDRWSDGGVPSQRSRAALVPH